MGDDAVARGHGEDVADAPGLQSRRTHRSPPYASSAVLNKQVHAQSGAGPTCRGYGSMTCGMPVRRSCCPRTVMEILGHTTIRQTMDRYGHALPERIRAAADVMDQALS